eukprot:403331961
MSQEGGNQPNDDKPKSLFGNAANPFGNPPSTNLFNAPKTGTSLFGGQPSSTLASNEHKPEDKPLNLTSTSNSNLSGGLFGSSGSGGSLFGANSGSTGQQPFSGGFNAPTMNKSGGSGNISGTTENKQLQAPSSIFGGGSTSGSTSLFGQKEEEKKETAPAQTNTLNQPASQFGGFGNKPPAFGAPIQNATNAPGINTTTNLFGQPAATNQLKQDAALSGNNSSTETKPFQFGTGSSAFGQSTGSIKPTDTTTQNLPGTQNPFGAKPLNEGQGQPPKGAQMFGSNQPSNAFAVGQQQQQKPVGLFEKEEEKKESSKPAFMQNFQQNQPSSQNQPTGGLLQNQNKPLTNFQQTPQQLLQQAQSQPTVSIRSSQTLTSQSQPSQSQVSRSSDKQSQQEGRLMNLQEFAFASNGEFIVNGLARNQSLIQSMSLNSIQTHILSPDLHGLVLEFARIFKQNGDSQEVQRNLIRTYNLPNQIKSDLQKEIQGYLRLLYQYANRESVSEQNKKMINSMIQLFLIFDICHLSSSRSQMIYKLTIAIRSNEYNTYYAEKTRQGIVDDTKDFGEGLCRLFAQGDFEHIYKIIPMSSKYFKNKDDINQKFLESLQQISRYQGDIQLNEDQNQETFNQVLFNFQNICKTLRNSIQQIGQHKTNLHIQFQKLLDLIVGESQGISDQVIYGDSLFKRCLLKLMITPPGILQTENFIEQVVLIQQELRTQPNMVDHLIEMRPLNMLQQIDRVFPPLLSYHLRNLYLRFNLNLNIPDQMLIYTKLNNFYSREYVEFLVLNFQGLRNSQEVQNADAMMEEEDEDLAVISQDQALKLMALYTQQIDNQYQQTSLARSIIDSCTIYTEASQFDLILRFIDNFSEDYELRQQVLKDYVTYQFNKKCNYYEALSKLVLMDQSSNLLETLSQTLINKVTSNDNKNYLKCMRIIDQIVSDQQNFGNIVELSNRSKKFDYLMILAYLQQDVQHVQNAQGGLLQKQTQILNGLTKLHTALRVPNHFYIPVLKTLEPFLLNPEFKLDQENYIQLSRVIPHVQQESNQNEICKILSYKAITV